VLGLIVLGDREAGEGQRAELAGPTERRALAGRRLMRAGFYREKRVEWVWSRKNSVTHRKARGCIRDAIGLFDNSDPENWAAVATRMWLIEQ